MGPINQEKEKFWRMQMTLAERHGGSFESFCRLHGLSPHTFAYWRARLRRGTLPSKALVPTKFIPVEIAKPDMGALLPDPRWCAEFIRHLSGESQ